MNFSEGIFAGLILIKTLKFLVKVVLKKLARLAWKKIKEIDKLYSLSFVKRIQKIEKFFRDSYKKIIEEVKRRRKSKLNS